MDHLAELREIEPDLVERVMSLKPLKMEEKDVPKNLTVGFEMGSKQRHSYPLNIPELFVSFYDMHIYANLQTRKTLIFNQKEYESGILISGKHDLFHFIATDSKITDGPLLVNNSITTMLNFAYDEAKENLYDLRRFEGLFEEDDSASEMLNYALRSTPHRTPLSLFENESHANSITESFRRIMRLYSMSNIFVPDEIIYADNQSNLTLWNTNHNELLVIDTDNDAAVLYNIDVTAISLLEGKMGFGYIDNYIMQYDKIFVGLHHALKETYLEEPRCLHSPIIPN